MAVNMNFYNAKLSLNLNDEVLFDQLQTEFRFELSNFISVHIIERYWKRLDYEGAGVKEFKEAVRKKLEDDHVIDLQKGVNWKALVGTT